MSESNATQDYAPIEFDERPSMCTIPGCGGIIVRHSLGGGQSDIRCIRCFQRYRQREAAAFGDTSSSSRLRRVLNEFASWRE